MCHKAADINEMDFNTQIIDLVKEKELKVEDYEARVKIFTKISTFYRLISWSKSVQLFFVIGIITSSVSSRAM